MRRTSLILILFVLIAFTSKIKGQWLAGYAEAIITPPLGTFMVEPQAHRATAIHDELYLKVIVVSDGKTKVAMASYDLVGMDLEFVAAIKRKVAQSDVISASNLMLSCTHAHNVPLTISLGGESDKRNPQWEAELIDITTATIKKALDNMHLVNISSGKADVQIAFNRRLMMFNRARMIPNPYGPVIREVAALNFELAREAGTILFSYPAHPVSVHNGKAEFTADFPAYAVKAIKKLSGKKVHPVYFQGCAGDINVEPLQGGYKAAEQVGQKLGKATLAAVKAGRPVKLKEIKTINHSFYLPYRPIEPAVADKLVTRVQEGLQALRARETDSIQLIDTEHVLHWSRIMQEVAHNPDQHPGLPFEIQSFAFSKELAIIAFPHELFIEYQLYIQEHSPFENTFVFAYTNGSESYIPTAEAIYLNGYEIHGAQHRYARPYLSPEIEQIIKVKSLDVLNDLYTKYGCN